MARCSYTYRFKVSATNDGYDYLQEYKPRYVPNEIIYTFGQEVEKIVGCDNGTFVIKREDIRFRQPITLKKNKDVLCYQLRNIVSNYLSRCGVDKQDTCIVEYELLRKNTFSTTNEVISDTFRDEVKFMVNAIYAIGDNTLINPNEQIAAMRFEIPLNYVSSQIFYILNVRTTSDSPETARKYLKQFMTAFFRLIPKDVIEKYDTLYEKREKERKKNAPRYTESGEILSSIDRSKPYNQKSFALVSRLIRKDLIQEIGYIVYSVYEGQKFCFQSFASWKKVIIEFLKIDESLTKYEDSKTQSSILDEISDKRYKDEVERFLFIIDKYYHIRDIRLAGEASAIFYKFQTMCPCEYLNDKYKRTDPCEEGGKVFKRMEFKNLCLQYFGLKPNQMKLNDCVKVLNTKFNSYEDNLNVWDKIIPPKRD